jgi:hypothetical protein
MIPGDAASPDDRSGQRKEPFRVHLRTCRRAALIALIFAQGMVPALAQQRRMEIGLLICGLTKSDEAQGEAGVAPLRQTRELLCAFRPANGGPAEIYTGTLQSVGLEKELSEKRTMIWIVKGPRQLMGSPGVLEQVYAADLAANPSHSPPLVGETNDWVALQTLADEQVPAAADKKPPMSVAMIVLIALTLKSTPA